MYALVKYKFRDGRQLGRLGKERSGMPLESDELEMMGLQGFERESDVIHRSVMETWASIQILKKKANQYFIFLSEKKTIDPSD